MRIPQIQPGGTQLRTRSAIAPRTHSGRGGEALEVAGQAIKGASDSLYKKLDEARNYTELAQAEAYDAQALGQVVVESETEVDALGRPRQGSAEDLKTLDEKIAATEEGAMAGFTNKEVASRYKANRQMKLITTRHAAIRNYTENMIMAGKVATLEAVDALSDAFALTGDPATLDAIDVKIDSATKHNFFDIKEAYDEKVKQHDKAIEKRIRGRLAANPAEEKETILSGEYDLSADETAKWIEVADKAIKRKEKEVAAIKEEQLTNRGVDVGMDVINRKMTVSQVLQEMQEGTMDIGLGQDLVEWKLNPETVNVETDKEVWADIAKMSADPMSDFAKIQENIALAMKDGSLKAEDDALNFLLTLKGLYEGADKFKSSPVRQTLNAALKAINDVSSKLKREASLQFGYAVGRELFRRMGKGEVPPEKILDVTNALIKEETKKTFPDINTIPEGGELRIDAFGNKAMVYPDGTVKEIQ